VLHIKENTNRAPHVIDLILAAGSPVTFTYNSKWACIVRQSTGAD
jgi:hypothetical protein